MVVAKKRRRAAAVPPPNAPPKEAATSAVSREALKTLAEVDPLIRAQKAEREAAALLKRANNKTLKVGSRRVEFSVNKKREGGGREAEVAVSRRHGRQKSVSDLTTDEDDDRVSGPSGGRESDDGSELESDTEGDLVRTGNVPLDGRNTDHIGYDITGAKVVVGSGDVIGDYIRRSDDPDSVWRMIKDLRNQETLELTSQDIDIIRRVRERGFPIASFDPYGPDSTVDFYNPDAAIHPESNAPPPKRGFVPSMWEQQEVRRLVTLIKQGKIKVGRDRNSENDGGVYDVWGSAILYDPDPRKIKGPLPLPAPKMRLPEHAESYNPPPEYLFTEEERKMWMEQDPEDREYDFIPSKYNCLRRVPAYAQLIRERFNRCLDLYLCPRSLKMRMNIDPDSLLPELPDPKTLKPFPSSISLIYQSRSGGCGSATCISFDTTGTYLAVGYASGTVSIFQTSTSRHLLSYNVAQQKVISAHDEAALPRPPASSLAISCIKFDPALPLIAIAQDADVYVLNLGLLPAFAGSTDRQSSDADGEAEESESESEGDVPGVFSCQCAKEALCLENVAESEGGMESWDKYEMDGAVGWRIRHTSAVQSLEWHSKGLYLASVCPNAASARSQLGLHALQRQKSIRPFKKQTAGKIQMAKFHPKRRSLYVAFHRSLRLYDLQSRTAPGNALVKKFKGVDGVKDLETHPSGEHVIVGGANNRLLWFDHELGEQPYKTLRYHQSEVKSVGFHPTYPLAHSADKHGNLMVLHAKVYYDILTSPTIIPIRKLNVCSDLNATVKLMQCAWHPLQPWIAVALSTGQVVLYV